MYNQTYDFMVKTRIAYLTPGEKKKLSKALLGYGKLVEAAERTGLHINTLRIVALKGHGETDTIKAIRENLIGYDTNKLVKIPQ